MRLFLQLINLSLFNEMAIAGQKPFRPYCHGHIHQVETTLGNATLLKK